MLDPPGSQGYAHKANPVKNIPVKSNQKIIQVENMNNRIPQLNSFFSGLYIFL